MEQPSLDLDDLRAFFSVAETGSFARAAQRLLSSKSIVSRRVARLEATLQALLLQRTARGTHLTEAGHTYYEQARTALTQLESAAESLSESVRDISGPIRLSAPLNFGVRYLAPVLAEFIVMYPRVELDVTFEDRNADLPGEGFDLGIRLGELDDSTMIARTLGRSRRTVVASPDYIARHVAEHGPIARPEDLADCAILHYSSLRTIDLWRYSGPDGGGGLRLRPYQVSNSVSQLMLWVKAGLGVTLLPAYITGEMLQSGEAALVLPDIDWGTTLISALMPQGRGTPRRVRTLVDFLVLKFNNRIA
jgi:DNA-binding transcriptional LysR family regulator